MPEMKSESYIIVELGGALLFLGCLSFFFVPAYEKGAWLVINIISSGLAMVLGYKFGKGMPEQAGDARPGRASQSETTTKVSTQAPLEPTEK